MNRPRAPEEPLLPQDARELAAARQWSALVERAGALSDAALLAEPEVAFHCADALWRVGQADRALRLAQEVEARVRGNGNHWLYLNTLNVVGIALFELGRTTEAEERFSRLLEHATQWSDDEFAARGCNNLGVLANVRGRRDLALTYYQRALACYQRLGHVRGLAQTHYNLGISYRDLGFHREADAHYARAIQHAEASASEDVTALAEMERAVLRTHSGDGQLATSLAQRALRRFEKMGDPTGAAQATRVLAAAARVSGDYRTAAALLERALDVARQHSDLLLRAEVQRDRGVLLRDLGDVAAAGQAFEDAAAHFEQLGATPEADATRRLLLTLPLPPL